MVFTHNQISSFADHDEKKATKKPRTLQRSIIF